MSGLGRRAVCRGAETGAQARPGPGRARGAWRAVLMKWGEFYRGQVQPVGRFRSLYMVSTALRERPSLLGMRWVYTRSVKPGSVWPRYVLSALMFSPASRRTDA